MTAKRDKCIPQQAATPKPNPQNLKQFSLYNALTSSIKKTIDADRSDKVQN